MGCNLRRCCCGRGDDDAVDRCSSNDFQSVAGLARAASSASLQADGSRLFSDNGSEASACARHPTSATGSVVRGKGWDRSTGPTTSPCGASLSVFDIGVRSAVLSPTLAGCAAASGAFQQKELVTPCIANAGLPESKTPQDFDFAAAFSEYAAPQLSWIMEQAAAEALQDWELAVWATEGPLHSGKRQRLLRWIDALGKSRYRVPVVDQPSEPRTMDAGSLLQNDRMLTNLSYRLRSSGARAHRRGQRSGSSVGGCSIGGTSCSGMSQGSKSDWISHYDGTSASCSSAGGSGRGDDDTLGSSVRTSSSWSSRCSHAGSQAGPGRQRFQSLHDTTGAEFLFALMDDDERRRAGIIREGNIPAPAPQGECTSPVGSRCRRRGISSHADRDRPQDRLGDVSSEDRGQNSPCFSLDDGHRQDRDSDQELSCSVRSGGSGRSCRSRGRQQGETPLGRRRRQSAARTRGPPAASVAPGSAPGGLVAQAPLVDAATYILNTAGVSSDDDVSRSQKSECSIASTDALTPGTDNAPAVRLLGNSN